MAGETLNLYVWMDRVKVGPEISRISGSSIHDTPCFMMFIEDKFISGGSMAAGDRYHYWQGRIDKFKNAMIQNDLKKYNIFDGKEPENESVSHGTAIKIPSDQLKIIKESLDSLL